MSHSQESKGANKGAIRFYKSALMYRCIACLIVFMAQAFIAINVWDKDFIVIAKALFTTMILSITVMGAAEIIILLKYLAKQEEIGSDLSLMGPPGPMGPTGHMGPKGDVVFATEAYEYAKNKFKYHKDTEMFVEDVDKIIYGKI